MDQRSTWYVRSLIVIMVIGGILRFRNLDGPSFWLDELASVKAVMSNSWEDAMMVDLTGIGIVGWLNYQIASVVGNSDFALRGISAVSGIILVIIIAELGRRFHSESAGLIASAMLASSFFAVKYSQEFRPYMLVTALLWLGILLLIDKKKNKTWQTIAIIALFGFSFLAHILAGLVVVFALITITLQHGIEWWRDNSNIKTKSKREKLSSYLESAAGRTLMISFSLLALSVIGLKKYLELSMDSAHSTWIAETPENAHLVLLNEFFGYHWWGSSTDGLAEIIWLTMIVSPLIMLLHHAMSQNRVGVENQKRMEMKGEWLLWIIAFGSLEMVLYYSEFIRPLFVVRYLCFSMPAWFLLIGITITKTIDISIMVIERTKMEMAEQGTMLRDRIQLGKMLSVAIAFAFILNGVQWIDEDYSYYEVDTKSDFEGMSEWIDDNYDSNDPYIISQPNAFYWDLYLERSNSDIRVDEDVWGGIKQSTLDYIVAESPDTIIRLQGHGAYWDENGLTDVLTNGMENSTYVMTEERKFIKGKIQVYTLIEFSKEEGIE